MRNSGFQGRSNRQASSGSGSDASFFGKRQRDESFSKQTSIHATSPADRLVSIRRRQFSRLIEAAKTGPTRLAEILEMQERRIISLADGSDNIDPMLAYHIEEMSGLPHGWIENGTLPHIPDDVMAKLTADVFVPQEDVEAVFGSPAEMAATSGEASLLSEAVSSVSGAHDALREPVVTIKKSRKAAIVTNAPIESAPSASTPVNSAEPPVSVQNSSPEYKEEKVDVVQIAKDNLNLALGVFPSMRQFLVNSTKLSPSSISGSLTGSRALPLANVNLYESVMGLPTGWLRTPRSEGEILEMLVSSLGESVVSAPAPKRGRKPGQAAQSVTEKPGLATLSSPRHAPSTASRGESELPTTIPAIGSQSAPSVVSAAPVLRAEQSRSANASPVDAILDILVSSLRQGVADGSLGLQDITSIMNHAFERQKHS